MKFVTEPTRQVPIAREVDVAIAGGGVSGVFAAIAAARQGAKTLVIDRFGMLGGNIGPGFIAGGGMLPGRAHPDAGYARHIYPGLYGIPREFIDRFADLGGNTLQPYSQPPSDYANNVHLASYIAHEMLREAGGEVLLSTTVSDPIMEENRVTGLFIENKSGRQAISAKVVIDDTGEADVARRAGAPILWPKDEYHEIDVHAPNGMGLWYQVGGVDWKDYEALLAESDVSDEDIAWAKETLGETAAGAYHTFLPFMRKAHEKGAALPRTHVTLGDADLPITLANVVQGMQGTIHGRLQPARTVQMNAGDGDHISRLEEGLRMLVIEMVQIWRHYVPGFENAHIINIAPFLGTRGGPCIEGEHTMTMTDCMEGRLFDDVAYRYGQNLALIHTCEKGQCTWADVPYRVMVPKVIDGLLATGRCASSIPDTLLRNRMAAMTLGEATGIAAGICAKTDVQPRGLPRKDYQTALLDAGFWLGDHRRLKELGLV